jgi:hypothetical protein
MGVVTTGKLATALWPGIDAIVGEYERQPELFKMLFQTKRSEKNYEEQLKVYGLGFAQAVPEGQSITYDTFGQADVQRYQHISYATGYIITRNEVKDNLYMNLYEPRSRKMMDSVRMTRNTVAFNVLNNGFTSFTLSDGQPLFSASHPFEGTGGTFSNLFGANVSAELSELALEQIIIQIQDATDGRNMPIQLEAEELWIPTALQFTAERILKSTLQNDTANNAVNAMRSMGMLSKGCKVSRFLSDPNAWFIKTNAPYGLQHFLREEPEYTADSDFDSENLKVKVMYRESFGCTDPRGIYGVLPS